MRVFFIGNVSFSEEMLKALLEDKKVELVGLATKSTSSFNSDHVDLSYLAKKNGFSWKYVRDINAPHIISWIDSLKPDIIFCFGWSSLIKKDLLELPPKGVIGYHPAKLPDNRGRHPLIWALVLGLKETASTFFKMSEGADTGDILSQQEITIEDFDTATTLYNKITIAAKKQLLEFIPRLKNNEAILLKQEKGTGNSWRKRSQRDGLIDFRMTSTSIFNLVRALTKPYPGAEISYNNSFFKVWETSFGNNLQNNIEPGKILNIKKNAIEVKTGDGSIWLISHEIEPLPSIESYLQ
jgi:methionyl-tRNA formyltransferase